MRVHYFAVAAAILIASSAATSTSTESKLIARGLTEEKSLSTQRLLRTHKTSAAVEMGEEEERVLGFNVGIIDDIINGVQTKVLEVDDSTQVKFLLDGLKKENIRPEEAFKTLNVDKVTDDLLASK
ncbi:hypothetical protein PF010_g26715 [Phytophthora fragariae]|uniref:RxLR effector protein n=2 Tax=Phytophthora fragariae TaxID=53985 RepID=A0A6G0JW05_9STRA|nr:hypothetical protein PF010_g26715 [Phytophthora fragariae]KAE9176471.1 hypothetical protein PF004_g26077 [Phytophthora fragariae]